MPISPARPCGHASCGHLRPCPVHGQGRETYALRVSSRPWSQLYKRARWLRLRERYLNQHPLCECDYCRTVGGPQPARVVHHRVDHRGDLGLFYAEGNLMALAKVCHDRETRRRQLQEQGGYAP